MGVKGRSALKSAAEGKLRYRWVALAFFTAFTLHLLVFSYGPAIPLLIEEMGLTHAQAGFAFSACILTLASTRVWWGLILDRFGLRKVMALASALIAVSSALRGRAAGYWELVALQSALGVGLGAILPCLPKLVALWFPKKEEGFATGVYVAGFAAGNMAGLGLTPWLLDRAGGWRGAFALYGVLALFLAAAWWMAAERPGLGRAASMAEALSLVLMAREVWVLTGLFLFSAGCYDTVSVWLPYILQLKGAPPTKAGLLALLLPLGFLASGPAVGRLADRVGKRGPVMAGLGLASGLTLLSMAVSSGAALYAAIFLAGFCSIGVLTLTLAVPAGFKDAKLTASATGLASSIGNVGTVVMPAIVGYVKDVTGSFLPALTLLALMAEGAFILSLLERSKLG